MFVAIIILGFFAVVGLSHTILSIFYLIMDNKSDTEIMLIVPKIESAEYAESILRSAISKSSKSKVQNIVCFTDSFDDEITDIAKFISRDYKNVSFMSKDEFCAQLYGTSVDTKIEDENKEEIRTAKK